MPRPTEVTDRFESRIRNALRDFQELQLAVHQKRRQASLENRIAEQSVMAMTVYWETYINDLLISYVAITPRSYLQQVAVSMRQSLATKFKHSAKWAKFNIPDSISEAQVEKLRQ